MFHQLEGIRFLLERKSGLLAFEQGLGKTRVVIEAFASLRVTTPALRLLVICPNSLKNNWAAEIERFRPSLSTQVIAGPPGSRRRSLDQTTADVVVVNYELARGEMLALRALMTRDQFVLTVDESHFVKNRQSYSSRAALQLAQFTHHRWLLSGTPVTNAPADLFAQLKLVAGEAIAGSFESFAAEYSDAASSIERAAALASTIAPYVLRRTKAECLDLPSKTFVDLKVELPSWQRALYEQMRDGLISEVESMSSDGFRAFASTALTRLLRLSQIASNPQLVWPSETRTPAKVTELHRLVDALLDEGSSKIIIWSHYVRSIESLLAAFHSRGARALYGKVEESERQSVARAFQDDPGVRILIANPAAAGTGFTFTAATYAIYETLSWRYDYYAQSQDRNHRIGQTLPVKYMRLIASDTIEEVMAESLDRKGVMAKAILGDAGPKPVSFSELSAAEFCGLLRTNRLGNQARSIATPPRLR